MIIVEKIERECCDARKDLTPIRTSNKTACLYYYFCKHCGRHWRDEGGSEPDSPGLQPLPWPWEQHGTRVTIS